MSTYTVRNKETNQEITFKWNGDSPPTDDDMNEVFSAAKNTDGGGFSAKADHGGTVTVREYMGAPKDDSASISTLKPPLPSFGTLSQQGKEDWHKQLYNKLNNVQPPPPEKPEWRNDPNKAGFYGAGKALLEQAVRPTVEAAGMSLGMLAAPAAPLAGSSLGYGITSKGMNAVEDAYNRWGGEPVREKTSLGTDRSMLGETAESAVDVGTFMALGKAMDTGASLLGKLTDKSAPAINAKIKQIVTKGINKGVRPSVVNKGMSSQVEKYFERAGSGVKSIINNVKSLKLKDKSGAIVSRLPKTLDEFSQSIYQTKKIIYNKYHEMAKKAGGAGARVSFDSTIKNLKTIINDVTLQDNSPATIAYAKRKLEQYANRGSYSVLEAEKSIKQLNEGLKFYYAKPSPTTQGRAYVDRLIATNLRSTLDDAITAIEGPGYQAFKNEYGALSTIESDVTKRAIVDARKNTKGLADLTDVFSGYHVIEGMLSLNPARVTAGLTAKVISHAHKIANNPNRHIRKMFEKTDKLMSKMSPEDLSAEIIATQPPPKSGVKKWVDWIMKYDLEDDLVNQLTIQPEIKKQVVKEVKLLKFGGEKAGETSPPIIMDNTPKRPNMPKTPQGELPPKAKIPETTQVEGGGITPAEKALIERQQEQQRLIDELTRKKSAPELLFGAEKTAGQASPNARSKIPDVNMPKTPQGELPPKSSLPETIKLPNLKYTPAEQAIIKSQEKQQKLINELIKKKSAPELLFGAEKKAGQAQPSAKSKVPLSAEQQLKKLGGGKSKKTDAQLKLEKLIAKDKQKKTAPTKEIWEMSKEEYLSQKTNENIKISDIKRIHGIEGTKLKDVFDYAQRSKKGEIAPPIEIIKLYPKDKGGSLIEGHRRIEASKLLGNESIKAKVKLHLGPHKRAVRKALSEGKLVPKSVLKDYPEFTKKPKTSTLKKITDKSVKHVSKKVGDSQKIGKIGDGIVAKIERINGVDYELYNANKLKDNRGAIRVIDSDSGEVVSYNVYPDFKKAEMEYNKTLNILKK